MESKKYLEFKQNENSKTKTKVYDIFGTSQTKLGEIRFYPSWRTYSFQPSGGTVFDIKCLTEIIQFIDELNSEWRNSLKNKK